jgi:small conductance mechanosensitive channel
MLLVTTLFVVTVAVFSCQVASLAQIPAGLLPTAPAPSADLLPPGVRRAGNLEISTVSFDHQPLFAVAGPIVRNRQDPGNQIPVEVRAAQIEENLRQVLIVDPGRSVSMFGAYDTVYEPHSFTVTVKKVDGQWVLAAGDAAHGQDLTLMTVTDLDAKYYGMTAEDLAKRLQRQLQDVLVGALESRQPDLVRRHLGRVPWILGGMLVLTLLLWAGRLRVRMWREELDAVKPDDEPGRARIDKRLDIASILEWILLSVFALTWLGGALWILSLFPSTAALAQRFWTQLLYLVLIWFVAGLLDRIGNAAMANVSDTWQELSLRRGHGEASRQAKRIPTVVRALEGFKAILIYLVATGLTLRVLGLPSASVLTAGALLALAVSFAAQSIVKDLTTGFLILAEDQFAIGDSVTIGNSSGIVENLNLRITQVRDANGRLITIPNSQIAIVENATRTWSRVDFTIDVANDADVERALALVGDVAQKLYVDPEWYSQILEPPTVLGIETISPNGATLRLWVVTAPAQQYPVRRELNRRMLLAFREHGIALGIPQQLVRAPEEVTTQPAPLSEPPAKAQAAQADTPREVAR